MADPATDPASLEKEFLAAIENASTLSELEEVRLAALGKKGRVSELLKSPRGDPNPWIWLGVSQPRWTPPLGDHVGVTWGSRNRCPKNNIKISIVSVIHYPTLIANNSVKEYRKTVFPVFFRILKRFPTNDFFEFLSYLQVFTVKFNVKDRMVIYTFFYTL